MVHVLCFSTTPRVVGEAAGDRRGTVLLYERISGMTLSSSCFIAMGASVGLLVKLSPAVRIENEKKCLVVQ